MGAFKLSPQFPSKLGGDPRGNQSARIVTLCEAFRYSISAGTAQILCRRYGFWVLRRIKSSAERICEGTT